MVKKGTGVCYDFNGFSFNSPIIFNKNSFNLVKFKNRVNLAK